MFNSEWEVTGVHLKRSMHLPRLDGLGTWPAREGVRIDRVVRAVTADLA